MSKRTTDIVAYLTWIGFLVAYLAGDRNNSRFHLNQGLVLAIVTVAWNVAYRVVIGILRHMLFTGVLILGLGVLNYLVTIALLVFMILGIVHAVHDQESPLPIIGGIHIIG